MCGRYVMARGRQELLEEFQIGLDAVQGALTHDYNVAPTKPVPVVLTRPPAPGRASPTAAAEAVRQLRMMRWGLVPSWARDLSIGGRLINARVETLHEKPSFRGAFARRRCLLPADGYYEWRTCATTIGKRGKQPFFIRPWDGRIMGMAGLYELWRSPEGEWTWSCAVITTTASDDLGHIHDRMPMIVQPDRWEAWLDPAQHQIASVRDLLVPATAETLEAYSVSKRVNNVRNNGAELIQPLLDGDIPMEYPDILF